MTSHVMPYYRFDHVDVNGGGAHPLYKFLKERQPMSGKPNGEIDPGARSHVTRVLC